MNERIINIATTLYQCRSQAIFLKGEKGFIQLVRKYKPLFDQVMQDRQVTELDALRVLLAKANQYADPELYTHVICAVGCELSEPTVTLNEDLTPSIGKEKMEIQNLRKVHILVKSTVAQKNLHEEDKYIAGTYTVVFENDVNPDGAADIALDGFHNYIPIKILDDFTISVTTLDGDPLETDPEYESYSNNHLVRSVEQL